MDKSNSLSLSLSLSLSSLSLSLSLSLPPLQQEAKCLQKAEQGPDCCRQALSNPVPFAFDQCTRAKEPHGLCNIRCDSSTQQGSDIPISSCLSCQRQQLPSGVGLQSTLHRLSSPKGSSPQHVHTCPLCKKQPCMLTASMRSHCKPGMPSQGTSWCSASMQRGWKACSHQNAGTRLHNDFTFTCCA